MTSMIRLGLLLLLVCASPIAAAAGSAQAGAAKAAACVACHGPNGNSTNPQWPTLAGQGGAYVELQLKHFRDKSRLDPSGAMPSMAANLSDQDIEDLAAYFSSQTTAGLEADPSYWQAGRTLYRGGDRARAIPACVACHGPVGRGNPAAAYPMLRAQHSAYTMQQLNDFAADKRYTRSDKGDSNGGPNAQIMHTVASRLTPEDIRNLASYVQGMR
ncbi:MAG TPA: c-type cytochrome [Steroidobacteraceae bacterium]